MKSKSLGLYILAGIGAMVIFPIILALFGAAIGFSFWMIGKVVIPGLIILGIVHLIRNTQMK